MATAVAGSLRIGLAAERELEWEDQPDVQCLPGREAFNRAPCLTQSLSLKPGLYMALRLAGSTRETVLPTTAAIVAETYFSK